MTAKARMRLRTLSNDRARMTTPAEIGDPVDTCIDFAGFGGALDCDLEHEHGSCRGILRLRSRREFSVGVGRGDRVPPMRLHVCRMYEAHASIAILDGDARRRRLPTPMCGDEPQGRNGPRGEMGR